MPLVRVAWKWQWQSDDKKKRNLIGASWHPEALCRVLSRALLIFGVNKHTDGPRGAHIKNARGATEQYRVDTRFAEASKADELDRAISRLAKNGVEGLVVMSSAWFQVERRRIVTLAMAHWWPVVSSLRSFAEEGALLSYSADIGALQCRAAYYVDRILKGAKPGDLPIEQPMTFEMAVSLKTAKVFGLTMPPEIMVRATRVIE